MVRVLAPTFLCLLLFTSCKKIYSNRNFTTFKFSDFESTLSITTRDALFSDSLILPTKSEIIDDYFILIDQKGDSRIHIFNVHSSEYLGAFGQTGIGPGEISLPWVTGTDETGRFYTYDIKGRKILGWKPDSLLNNFLPEIEYKFNETGITSALAIDQGVIYFTDIANPQARFFSFDPTTGTMEFFGELPTLSQDVNDFIKSQAHRSILAKNKNKFFIANYLSPLYEIYESNKREWHTFVGPDEAEPAFGVNGNHFIVTKDTKLGYLDVKATDQYIYLLYSGNLATNSRGMDQGKDFFIFDHHGNPKKHLKLDKAISTFSVYNDSVVYATHLDIQPRILNFQFNDFSIYEKTSYLSNCNVSYI